MTIQNELNTMHFKTFLLCRNEENTLQFYGVFYGFQRGICSPRKYVKMIFNVASPEGSTPYDHSLF